MEGAVSEEVRGRVLWESSGEPVPGVAVSNGRDVTVTDAAGRYRLPWPPWGEFVFVTVPQGAACSRFFRAAREAPGALDFELRPARSNPAAIRFLQATDIHISERWTKAGELALDLAAIGRRHEGEEIGFIAVTGDLTDLGTEREFAEYKAAVAGAPFPVHSLPGNHDYLQPEKDRQYRAAIGPPYYSFEAGPVHIVCYDSAGEHALGEAYPAREWLVRDLALVPPERPVAVFTHFPPGKSFQELIRPFNVVLVLSGHWHGHRVFDDGRTLFLSTPPLSFGGIDYAPQTYRKVTIEAAGPEGEERGTPGGGPAPGGAHLGGGVPPSAGAPASGEGAVIARRGVTVRTETFFVTREGAVSSRFRETRGCEVASEGVRPAETGSRRAGSPRLSVTWRRRLAHVPSLMAAPVAAGDLLLVSVESLDRMAGGVVCLDRRSGEVVWEAELGGAVKGSPAVEEGRAVAVTIDGKVYCLDLASGSVRWRYDLPDPIERWIYHSPCIAVGSVVTGSPVHMVRIDLFTGEPVWISGGFGKSDWICSRISPVYGDGRIFAGFFGAHTGIVALSVADGSELWRQEGAWGVSCPSGTPAYDGGFLYLVRHTGRPQCLDPEDGRTIWEGEPVERWSPATPLVTGDTVIVTESTGRIAALDRRSGAKLWSWQAPQGRISVVPYRRVYSGLLAGPLPWRGGLLAAGLDGSLALLAPETGAVKASWPAGALGSAPVAAPIAAAGDALYAATLSGEVAAFRLDI